MNAGHKAARKVRGTVLSVKAVPHCYIIQNGGMDRWALLLGNHRSAFLTPDQKEIAECIGFEAYSKLAAYYGGSRVYVAKLASLELAERDSRIIRDYKAGKTSTAELAARYGVSPRRIREIIKKQQ